MEDEIVLPDGVELPIDENAAQAVEPNFQQFNPPATEDTVEAEVPEETQTEAETEEASPEPQTSEEQTQEPEEQGENPAFEVSVSDDSEESSLESELQQGQESVTEEVSQDVSEEDIVELNEETALRYLSEQLGVELSLEDLTREAQDPFENDPDLKALAEWREKTGRPISDWAKFQKDYSAMSDEALAREYLRYQYDDFTMDEIELEMQKYLPNEMDDESEARLRALQLKKFARDGRKELDSLRMELESPVRASLSQEQQQKIEAYDSFAEQQQAQQEAAKRNEAIFDQGIQDFDTLKLNLDKGFNIDFKPSMEAKQSVKDFMKMPHWYNSDGSLNADAVVADSFFLQNKEAIIQEVYKQGLSKGIAEIEKKTNNIQLDARNTQDQVPQNDEGIVIEAAEEMKRTWRSNG
jgi:hypothetical protein